LTSCALRAELRVYVSAVRYGAYPKPALRALFTLTESASAGSNGLEKPNQGLKKAEKVKNTPIKR
jgi:hypothetical protein